MAPVYRSGSPGRSTIQERARIGAPGALRSRFCAQRPGTGDPTRASRRAPDRTDRLLLRPFSVGDAPALAAYRSDELVARFQGWEAPFPRHAADRFAREMAARGCLAALRDGEWNQVAIEVLCEQTAGGSLIGDCAFQIRGGEPRAASIGFTIARASQGRGYATEAVRALIGSLAARFGVEIVEAVCDAENIPSQRTLEQLGMRHDPSRDRRVLFKGRWTIDRTYSMRIDAMPTDAMRTERHRVSG
ncbi:MAG: GNAT family protein [Phycisphaerales bacterium]